MLYVYLYGGLAGALITFIVAVILFIKLDIIEVIYDLLGIRRRRRKPKKKKKKWDKKPVPIIPTKDPTVHVQLRGESARFGRDEVLPTVEMEDTVLLSDSEETTVIDDGDETTLLGEDTSGETTLLGEEATESPQPFFRKDIDIIVVHSHITI